MWSEARALATKALEGAINAYLRLDPATHARLQELEGKLIAVEISGLPTPIYMAPGANGIRLLANYTGEPDARLRGTPLALVTLSLADQRKASSALFQGDVEIAGDIEVGQRFKAILDDLEVDWEEQLSHLVGDVIAHQAGNAARGFAQWARDSGSSLERDLGEYLQEESRWLPTRSEVKEWLDEVDTLRADVDRLEARLRRLQTALESGGD